MSDLIHELELLGADVDWPATPAFTPRAEPARARSSPPPAVAPADVAIALGVLALAAGALAATGVIHFGGATITRVDTLPPGRPAPKLQLGTPITLARGPQASCRSHSRRAWRARTPPTRVTTGVSLLYLGTAGRTRVLTILPRGPRASSTSSSTRRRRSAVSASKAPAALYVAGRPCRRLHLRGQAAAVAADAAVAQGRPHYRLEARDALALASGG